jgi:hypothetical protein
VIEDHRHRLEIPPASSFTETLHQFKQRVRTLRDYAAACFGRSRPGGQSGYTEGYGAETEKRVPSSSINSHSILPEIAGGSRTAQCLASTPSLCRL